MKKIIFLIGLIGCFAAKAQTFIVSGKLMEIKDTQTTPVAFAEAVLLIKDSAVKNTLTNNGGSFSISAPRGDYTLLLRRFGDTLYTQPIGIFKNIDLGTLKIKTSGELQTVSVTAQKPLIERKVDRLVFNVSRSAAATGGDALDALKVTPGLNVQNDQISMIGKSGLSVMINDRILNLSGNDLINYLKSIKSENIESIEVITTPPAKYDAEGNSGIINIKLKKAQPNSWNASIYGAYTQFHNANTNEGASFTYNKNKLSFNANVSHNDGTYFYRTENETIYYPDTLYNSFSTMKWNYAKNISANAGIDYDFSKKLTMGVQYIYTLNDVNTTQPNNTYLYGATANNLLQTFGNGYRNNNGNNLNYHAVYQFDTLGKKAELNFDYFDYNTAVDNVFKTKEYANLTDYIDGSYDAANNGSSSGITNYSVKLDITHPLKWMDLSYGGKLSFTKNNASTYYYDLTSGTPVFQDNRSDVFVYTENLQALYASANKKMGKWQAQAGLRMENTVAKGASQTLAETNNYNYLKLFPTAYLQYAPNTKSNFSINYSKRVDRPGFYSLNPFTRYINPYSTSQGNPFLQPSFTHNIEFNYTYKNNWNTTVYFSRSLNNSTQVEYVSTDNIYTATKWENAYNQTSVGITETYTFRKWKWLESWNMANAGYNTVQSLLPQYIPGNSGIAATLMTRNTFNLNAEKTFSLSLDYLYMFPQYFAGVDKLKAFSILGVGAKALLLKKKLTASLYADDIFKTAKIRLTTSSSGIPITFNNYESRQSIRLSLSYSFGNSNISGKRVNAGNEDEKNRAR